MSTETVEMTSAEMARELAAVGAEAMDEIRPDWYRDINLSLLDMSEGSSCIIGQLWGDYRENVYDVADLLDPETYHFNDDGGPGDEKTYKVMMDHGLWVDPENWNGVHYSDLTAAWKNEVQQRLNN